MATNPNRRLHNRKRQHAEADLSQDDLPPLHSKKLKSTREHHSSSFPPEFWDSLSKVWLTCRALREVDRRNQLKSIACARVPAPKPAYQFSNPEDLQRFARHGGPELGDLRGYPEPTINLEHTMSSRSSKSKGSRGSSGRSGSKSTNPTSNSASESSKKKKSTSAYDANFEQYLVSDGIYPKGYEYPNDRQTPEPDNLDEMCRDLAAARPSLSLSQFTDSDFRRFKRANARVISEPKVRSAVIPEIFGDMELPEEDLLFANLESITKKTIVRAQPDYYDGARLKDIHKGVLEDIDKCLEDRSFIIPTKHPTAPVVPNFFLEVKASKGGADVAKRQACYDGALGARAMQQLQSYAVGEPVYDKNAYTITSTYHAGNLKMYATHVTLSGPGCLPEYHMTQLRGMDLSDNPNTCREGLTHLRNSRVWTKEKRDQFISAANDRATSMNTEPSTLESSNYNGASDTIDSNPVESQTSADELAATSIAYPAEEPFYGDLSDIAEEQYEEDDFSANELALDMPPNPTPS